VQLTSEESEILAGKHGDGIRAALEYQVQLGKFYGAKSMVPVSNAHFTGDYEVMDAGGYEYLKKVSEGGGKVRVPTTRNATCVDPAMADLMRQRAELVDGEALVGPLLSRMGVLTTNTCVNYQSVYVPNLGDTVAWGDTGTVAYANGVLGARTNYEAGPASLFAGVTGRTPGYGFHLDEARKANVVVNTSSELKDYADWGVLGRIVGKKFRGYENVAAIVAPNATPSPDKLKHLAASIASHGSMGMFHVVGATPEAPTLEVARGERPLLGEMTVSDDDIRAVYTELGPETEDVELVVFTAPQLSLLEVQDIVSHLGGRRVNPNVQLVITVNSAVSQQLRETGLMARLTEVGVLLTTGTCWYLMDPAQMQKEFGWKSVVTNSAKLANIIAAHNYRPVLRTTAECVEAAVKGTVSK